MFGKFKEKYFCDALEIILADDASDDKTKSFLEDFVQNNPKFYYIEIPAISGL